jgi:hypothetical protein
MGGWGLVGVFGAALGAATGHRLGRWGLAAACAAAGAAYGLLLDFSTWITFVGDHTVRSFLAYSATSFSFNVAHVVGNVVFCLAFGPALVRAIARSRERLQVTWRPAPAALPPAGSCSSSPPASPSSPAWPRPRRPARTPPRARRRTSPRRAIPTAASAPPRRAHEPAAHRLGRHGPGRRGAALRRAAGREPAPHAARVRETGTSSARSWRCAPAGPGTPA